MNNHVHISVSAGCRSQAARGYCWTVGIGILLPSYKRQRQQCLGSRACLEGPLVVFRSFFGFLALSSWLSIGSLIGACLNWFKKVLYA